MTPANTLFILSDEHTRDVTGAYGHPIIKTPNIDALAARGAKFTNAYTNCPICVPARASLQTGCHVGDIGYWDNAHPYEGKVRSWGHRLIENGHRSVSIGKLHFRSTKDNNGFDEEIIPMHVVDGVGDLLGMIRNPPAERGNMKALARDLGPGHSTYADYDRDTAARAVEWLKTTGKNQKKPFLLFVSFVKPHFPLIAPPEFYALYDPAKLPMPRLYAPEERPRHPVVHMIKRMMNYDDFFTSPEHVKRAIANYFAMVSFLDHNIGVVLKGLEEAGLAANTRVVYTTDHGDNVGARGLWGKSVHYEEACAVPLVVAGPGVPQGKTVKTAASLVDCYQTIIEGAGLPATPDEAELPGRSLWRMANEPDAERVVLSEYHAACSITGMFMVRKGRWKYTHYVGYRPELFDMETDPGETRDLGESADHADIRRMMEAELRTLMDPDKVNAKAFADQAARIKAHGGETAIFKRGDFGYSPAPGQKPVFA